MKKLVHMIGFVNIVGNGIMNCPVCDGELTIDQRNKWILCTSNDHKFKVTDWDDVTVKTITLKILSQSVMAVKSLLSNPATKLDKLQKTHLEGQISAWQSMADYLRERDWEDFKFINNNNK